MSPLVLGSRGCALALAQVQLVRAALASFHPDLEIETAKARALLGETVPLADAIRQWANLGALIEAQSSNDNTSYKIALVISNNDDVGGLQRARDAGIATLVIPHKGKSREVFDGEMDAALAE